MKSRVWRARRRRRGDLVDRLGKAHVEHPVGLVQHQDLQPRQVEAAALQMVDQPARGGDDQVDRGRQQPLLFGIGHAAENRPAADAQVLAVAAHGVGDLVGQLPGRGQHQDTRPAAAAGRRGAEPLQRRQNEGRGLAGPGLGGGGQIAARQDQGDGPGLDRGRGGVAAFGDGFENVRGKRQFVELHKRYLAYSRSPAPFRSAQGGNAPCRTRLVGNLAGRREAPKKGMPAAGQTAVLIGKTAAAHN